MVVLGDSYATVRAKLGAPTLVRSTFEDGVYTMWTDYDALQLRMSYEDTNGDGQLNDDETVDGLFANSFMAPYAWNYQGLTFGSSRANCLSVLGTPSRDFGTGAWWFSRGVFLYWGSADSLSQIYVFPPY